MSIFASWKTGIGQKVLIAASVGVCTLTQFQPAEARDLKNFVTDLFGGQGIGINDPGEGLETIALNQGAIVSFGNVNSSISSNLGSGALSSAVSSSLFNINQGMPVETTESLGPLVGERAETLGKGHYDFGVSFTHLKFTQLNGAPLNNLRAQVSQPGGDDIINLNLNLDVSVNAIPITAAYGITPRWDVGIIIPILSVTAKASATAFLNDTGNDGDLFPNGTLTEQSSSGGTASGVGDIIMRSKYNMLRDEGPVDLAIYNELKLPTGDQNNLLGTGNTDALAEIVLSKQLGPVAPHLNLGYQFVMGQGPERSNLRYVVGMDSLLTRRVGFGADIVGLHADNGLNLVDLVIGAKWNIFNHNIVSAEAIVPINRSEGLRPDYGVTARWELFF